MVKIRLFQYASGHIYVGLYPYLLDWAKRTKYSLLMAQKLKMLKIKPKLVDRFLSALKTTRNKRLSKRAFIHSIQKKKMFTFITYR